MNEADEKLLNEFVAQLEKIVAEKSAKQTAAPTYPRVKPEDRTGSWYNAYASFFAAIAMEEKGNGMGFGEFSNEAAFYGKATIEMADLAMHALEQGDKLIEVLIEKESPKPAKLNFSSNNPAKQQVSGVCYCCGGRYQYKPGSSRGAFCSESCFDYYWER